jgi:hypothetical protein
MEVQVREKCGACENGVVRSGPWEVFAGEEGYGVRHAAEQLRKEGRLSDALDLELAWFRERGWTVEGHDGFGEGFPADEEPCPDCEGEGHTVRWVPIDELPLAVEVKRLRLGLSSLDSHLLGMGERS